MARGPKVSHHLVKFATSFSRSSIPTLDAATAISRLETLIDDVSDIAAARDAASTERSHSVMGDTYEIVDYFSVGFVTCLEWHARSRLVDLLRSKPDCIEASDVQRLEKTALVEMTAAEVTLPYIVGAGTKVSSMGDYVRIFNRVFTGLNIEKSPSSLLAQQVAPPRRWYGDESRPLFEAVSELFEYRNSLVHEIGPSQMAHFSLRAPWMPEDAATAGAAALACMRTLEQAITKFAPKDLPNRIEPDGYTVSEIDRLTAQINALELEISDIVKEEDEAAVWEACLANYRSYAASEDQYLSHSSLLRPVRHLYLSMPARLASAHGRVDFLRALKEAIDVEVP